MNIIITGGSSGIGLETAKVLSENKENNIIVTGRNETALKKVSDYSPYHNIIPLITDFTTLASNSESILKFVRKYFDKIDILINNAGYLYARKFDETDDKEARLMMEINFFVPAMLIRLFLPMIHRGSHIVNISSMGGYQGSQKFPGLSFYSASKAAIACLTECLATELIEREIYVNCIAPGSVQTEMFDRAFPGQKANLSAEEMGKFLAWFAINGHRYFNGKIIPVAMVSP
ncbi:MAG: SDR family oxidoreductase [Bacteroidales bacterium]